MNKVCSRCKQEKPANHDFFVFKKHNINNGFLGECRVCKSEMDKEYRENNVERLRENSKTYRHKNDKEIKERKKQYYLDNRERLLIKQENYRLHNLERTRENARNSYYRRKDEVISRQVERRRNDPKLRINHSFSSRMRMSLKVGKGGKGWQKLVDYTLNDLVEHLEVQFTDEMSWDNYGRASKAEKWWSIDHIRPVVSFQYETYDDPHFKACWALSNLQPMWIRENCSKNDCWPKKADI